ncbi:Inositol-pentakisphosphate 2-kinase [Heterocephalus glaber]|uniref:Inositol-pentakisphosphate 2-kinase n=1 Tax=Heterocephalus glaber TaxID=10181 RepID=G5BUT6_HETGA|nr:Inositol-pentakisphosphate 2-kinase [Heterocephalus glaber]
MVLLSSSDKGQVENLKLGPWGPHLFEASPFSRSLHCQGKTPQSGQDYQRGVFCTKPSRSPLAFSVFVLELNLKPYESIPYQCKLDANIVNYYSKTMHAKDDTVMSTWFKESEDCTLVLHKV